MSPQQTIAHYRILAKIGEGGMGEVYRALDTKLNREVAVKVIPESERWLFLSRFRLPGACGNLDSDFLGRLHLELHRQVIGKEPLGVT